MTAKPIPALTQQQQAAFWSRVKKTSPGDCWLWTGTGTDGYGYYSVAGRTMRAHRVAYWLVRGPFEAETLDHLCRNRACVNPANLEPATNRENILRGDGVTAQLARQTTCKRGHPLSGTNLYIRPSAGFRECRTCRRESEVGRDRYKAKPDPLVCVRCGAICRLWKSGSVQYWKHSGGPRVQTCGQQPYDVIERSIWKRRDLSGLLSRLQKGEQP